MQINISRMSVLVALAASVALAACHNDSTAPLVAASVREVAGDSQTVVVGSNTLPLAVKVLAADGEAVAGATVTWSLVSGDGTLSSTESTTDALGLATVSYMPTNQGTNVISAIVASAPAYEFTVTAVNPVDSTSTSGN